MSRSTAFTWRSAEREGQQRELVTPEGVPLRFAVAAGGVAFVFNGHVDTAISQCPAEPGQVGQQIAGAHGPEPVCACCSTRARGSP